MLASTTMPTATGSRVKALLEEPLESLRESGAGKIAIATVLDTTPPLPDVPWSPADEVLYYLPQATDSEICLVVWALKAPARKGRNEYYSALRFVADTAAHLVGPCAYFAAFGSPGPEIAHWLATRDFDLARNPFWLTGSDPAWQMAPDDLRWLRWPSGSSFRMAACAAGRKEECRRRLLDVDRSIRSPVPKAILRSGVWYWGSSLGPDTPRFLSDLVKEMGAERFAEFWTSDLDPESAFEAAFGVPIAQWTMEWMHQQVGRPRFGPGVPLAAALLALLLAALSVVVSVAYVSRRQVR
jgi:hypothetical protein